MATVGAEVDFEPVKRDLTRVVRLLEPIATVLEFSLWIPIWLQIPYPVEPGRMDLLGNGGGRSAMDRRRRTPELIASLS